MNIEFSADINKRLTAIRLGIIAFEAIIRSSDKCFWSAVSEASDNLRGNISASEITQNSEIAQTRIAYKKCGKDPSRYRPSADSLMRRIIKGNELYKVNNVVDCLNLVSMQSGFSIGGYDRSKIEGQAILDIGKADEEYYGIGRGLLNIEGMPVLRDNTSVFGSPTSDSERTMITEKTKEIAFVFFDFGVSDQLETTINESVSLLEKYCQVQNIVITKNNRSLDF